MAVPAGPAGAVPRRVPEVWVSKKIELMTPAMLDGMRAACRMAAETLTAVGAIIRPGITTNEINEFVHDHTVSQKAYPAPLNYKGFPKSVCTSVNECICHGIPSSYRLRSGDIVNVDVTTYFPLEKGFHGDTSVTFYVGEPSEAAKKVTEVARQALELGIAAARPGGRIRDIGAAIEDFVTAQGCSVVEDFVGHGVGREFHMAPQVPHYRFRGPNPRLKPGMVFTIEPMVNLGNKEVQVQSDEWTALTRDRSLSAQFEHTIAVHEDRIEVLTYRDALVRGSEDVPWAKLGPLSTPAAFSSQPGRAAASGS